VSLLLGSSALPAAAQGPSNAVVEYYHLDALGSVRAVTDATGTVVRRHDYFPFGEEAAPPPGADSLRFAGKARDGETGLDYFQARYYASRAGRFTTVDPGHVGGNILDPQSWNAYAYARNNPFRFVDPTGTDYYINIEGGSPFWFEGGSNNEFGQLKAWAAGYEFRGGMWGGDIYNAAGVWVGSYSYADKIVHLAADIAGRTRGVVEAVGVGVAAGQVALAFTNPIASTAANCVLGNCSGGDAAMAVMPSGRFWSALKPFRGKTKTNGLSGGNRRFYEPDRTHGDIEVYDARGRHLGSANPATGAMTKPAVPGRRIDVR
jgi:RHS repeat-associated protein